MLYDDSDQDSGPEDINEEEPYDGSLAHLHHVEHLIQDSVAYQALCHRFYDLVYPSLQSKLRDLVVAWSRPDHEHHEHVSRYRLSNLIAELQYIRPQSIVFGKEDGTNSNCHNITALWQGMVERWTGERWDWWPLLPYLRPSEELEMRVRWKCVSFVTHVIT